MGWDEEEEERNLIKDLKTPNSLSRRTGTGL